MLLHLLAMSTITPPEERFTRESAEQWARYIVKKITKRYPPAVQDYYEDVMVHMVTFKFDATMVIRFFPEENRLKILLNIPNVPADRYNPDPSFFEVSRGSLSTTIIKNLLGPKYAMETKDIMHNMLCLALREHTDNLVETHPNTPM